MQRSRTHGSVWRHGIAAGVAALAVLGQAGPAVALDDLGVVSGDTFELPGYNDGPSGGGVWPGSRGSGGDVGAMPLPGGVPDSGGSPQGGPGGGGGSGIGDGPKVDQTRPPYLSPKGRNTPKAVAPFNESQSECSERPNLGTATGFSSLLAPVDQSSVGEGDDGSNLPVPRSQDHADIEWRASTAMNTVRYALDNIVRAVARWEENSAAFPIDWLADEIASKMQSTQEALASHVEWAKFALGCENLEWLKQQKTDRVWRIWAKVGYAITQSKVDMGRGTLQSNPHVMRAPAPIKLMIAKLELALHASTANGIKALYRSSLVLGARDEGLRRYFFRMYLAHGGTAEGILDPYSFD